MWPALFLSRFQQHRSNANYFCLIYDLYIYDDVTPLDAADDTKIRLMETHEKFQVMVMNYPRSGAMDYGNDEHGSAYTDFCAILYVVIISDTFT